MGLSLEFFPKKSVLKSQMGTLWLGILPLMIFCFPKKSDVMYVMANQLTMSSSNWLCTQLAAFKAADWISGSVSSPFVAQYSALCWLSIHPFAGVNQALVRSVFLVLVTKNWRLLPKLIFNQYWVSYGDPLTKN